MKNLKKLFASSAAAVLSLAMLAGCGTPSYDGFQFPAAEKSELKPLEADSYYIKRDFEGKEATKEKTEKKVLSSDGLCVIEKKSTYYEVTLDYEKGSHKEIGAAYAEAIKKAYPDYPKMLEGYLFELITDVFGENKKYDELTDRVNTLKASLSKEYKEEMESFAEVMSGGENGIKKDGKLSFEEACIVDMVPDALRATACSTMTVNGNKTKSGHRIAARILEWIPGSENQLEHFHCVTHFKNGSSSFTSVGLLGMLDVLTAVNDDGVMVGEHDVGSGTASPFEYKGKTCYSYDLRYVMENCTNAKTGAEYVASRSDLYTYNVNDFVADDKDAFCVELAVGEGNGKTVIRDSSTKLNKGVEWTDTDCFCIVNSFVAEGNYDLLLGIDSNFIRWKKYDQIFSSEKEKMSLARFKELMTVEKIKDSPVVSFRGETMVHMAVFDFDTHSMQVLFSGNEDPDDIEWIDLGKQYN